MRADGMGADGVAILFSSLSIHQKGPYNLCGGPCPSLEPPSTWGFLPKPRLPPWPNSGLRCFLKREMHPGHLKSTRGEHDFTQETHRALCSRFLAGAGGGRYAPPRSQAEVNRDRSKAVATWRAVSMARPCMALMNCSVLCLL